MTLRSPHLVDNIRSKTTTHTVRQLERSCANLERAIRRLKANNRSRAMARTCNHCGEPRVNCICLD